MNSMKNTFNRLGIIKNLLSASAIFRSCVPGRATTTFIRISSLSFFFNYTESIKDVLHGII